MKKGILFTLLMTLPLALLAQSTEGTDFWVTMMRADDNNPTTLSLTVSAHDASHVVVENPYTGYKQEFDVAANGIYQLTPIDSAHCYVGNAQEERVSNRALHVTATTKVSLVAANYRDKSFDVAAILPTKALQDEYRIQCYTPSAHEDDQQGTQFAIVATEDNTVIKIVPTERTEEMNAAQKILDLMGDSSVLTERDKELLRFQIGKDTLTTPVMSKGQVYYIWTGVQDNSISAEKYDLSGTSVQSNKPVAVFNGNPHTNIPYQIRDRDHIYSQAVPTDYWGTKFAVMSSLTTRDNHTGTFERTDKVRVMALEDGTELYINGQLVHTFDFSSTANDDRKHFFEFEFGTFTSTQADPLRPNIKRIQATSCWIETSCPAAVHQFLVSNTYDYPKKKQGGADDDLCNGDPSELWVNPIEQGIDTITFGTFQTTQVQDHFLNIVTKGTNVSSLKLDGTSISDKFATLNGNAAYSFARFQIDNGTHTLTADSGFIANVYGFGTRESYSYPAGAYTKDLTQYITINGQKFEPGKHNTLCGKDTIEFTCDLNYEYEKITWNFGDGSPMISGHGDSVEYVKHYYPKLGTYPAYILIERKEISGCASRQPVDSIAIEVSINHFVFSVGTPTVDCDNSQLVIPFYNPNKIDLTGENVTIGFDSVATADGFKRENLKIEESSFNISIPTTAKDGIQYGLTLHISNPCGEVDTAFNFSYNKDILVQRFDRVLGLKQSFLDSKYPGDTVTAYNWTKDGVFYSSEPIISLSNTDYEGKYTLCFTISGKTICSCPVSFDATHTSEDITITPNSPTQGAPVRIEISNDADATWVSIDGRVYRTDRLRSGVNTITAPGVRGIYILRIVAEKSTSHKMIVQ